MDPKKFGIFAGIFVIVLAMIITLIGHFMLPGNNLIPGIGIVLIILGVIFAFYSIISQNKSNQARRREEEDD